MSSPWKIALAFAAPAVLLAFTTPADGQTRFPLNLQAGQKKEGGVSVDAFAKISRQRDKGLIEAKLWIRKSGLGGIGYGMVQFIFLDKDTNTIWKSPPLAASVGAKFPEGTHEKNFTRDFDVPLDILNATHAVAVATAVRDTGVINSDEFNHAFNTLKAALGKAIEDLIRGGRGGPLGTGLTTKSHLGVAVKMFSSK
jgi:hypothetical protein